MQDVQDKETAREIGDQAIDKLPEGLNFANIMINVDQLVEAIVLLYRAAAAQSHPLLFRNTVSQIRGITTE